MRVNCSLFGIGERTGNTPLEAMVFEYAQLRGTLDGMDTTVITELAEYYEKEIGYTVPSRTPFVGKNFNVTRAGIHADGMLKNEEIYNIFDTDKFLNVPHWCRFPIHPEQRGSHIGSMRILNFRKNGKLIKIRNWYIV